MRRVFWFAIYKIYSIGITKQLAITDQVLKLVEYDHWGCVKWVFSFKLRVRNEQHPERAKIPFLTPSGLKDA